MAKGYTRYRKHETAILKAYRDMLKVVKRLSIAAEELQKRPVPVIPEEKTKAPSPPRKAANAKQLKLPGTAKRKAAKQPAKRK